MAQGRPHFADKPADVQVFRGYSLFPDRVGNFVAKPMAESNGTEILQELCGHLRFDAESVAAANCIPCRMPCITSMFMPRQHGDRSLPVPRESKNLAFVSQFVEIEDDVVFTVEYSVRAMQIAVYELPGIDREVPPVTPHDKSLRTQCEALVKSLQEVMRAPAPRSVLAVSPHAAGGTYFMPPFGVPGRRGKLVLAVRR